MAIKIVAPKAPASATARILPPAVAPDVTMIQERFPRVGEQITQMWGTVGLKNFLNQIIFDDRGGRQGFPLDVVSALMRIHDYHAKVIPDLPSGSAWDHIL